MDSSSSPSTSVHVDNEGSGGDGVKDKFRVRQPLNEVDSFIAEALENPKHRLTVLRMELDIQGFMRNPDQHQFEFQHFPTSYLRCAAHRVAQHYGLQTMVLDVTADGSGRIVVRKNPESRFPDVCLSELPTKQPESSKAKHVKVILQQRQIKDPQKDIVQLEIKYSPVTSIEKRKEDYDKARSRIFSSTELEVTLSQVVADGSLCSIVSGDENSFHSNSPKEPQNISTKDGASRVAAIFKDTEKDRKDPDYDRSYGRYTIGINQSFNLDQHNVLEDPKSQCETSFCQTNHLQKTQASRHHGLSNQIMNPYLPTDCNQYSNNAVYLHWSTPALMHEQSNWHFGRPYFQVLPYNLRLSFEDSLNRWEWK